MNDDFFPFFSLPTEMIEFVKKLKSKYEDLIKDSQFDTQKKVADLVEKIADDMLNEIDNKYNSDMRMFKLLNDCFKNQSKIYHAFVDFIHDFGIKNGKRSLFY